MNDDLGDGVATNGSATGLLLWGLDDLGGLFFLDVVTKGEVLG